MKRYIIVKDNQLSFVSIKYFITVSYYEYKTFKNPERISAHKTLPFPNSHGRLVCRVCTILCPQINGNSAFPGLSCLLSVDPTKTTNAVFAFRPSPHTPFTTNRRKSAIIKTFVYNRRPALPLPHPHQASKRHLRFPPVALHFLRQTTHNNNK